MNYRNISLDLLKIILAIFVVLLHANFFSDYNETLSYLSVEGLFRIAVPTFFLINGYFFKHIVDNKKIIKWSKRVIILYSVWTIIYLPFWTFSIKSIIINIFIGYFHLWYIQALLLSGIILFYTKKLNSKNMLMLAFFLFSVGVVIQYSGNYHMVKVNILDRIMNFEPTYRNFLFLGLPFFIIGYLINKDNWNKLITPKQTLLLITLGMIFIFIESYINYYYTKEAFDNLFSLIFICPLIFIYTINLNLRFNINSKNIALVSTAIYLVHPLIRKILNMLFTMETTFLSILTIVFSFFISLIIIEINTKIKFLL